jgi:hypothetical protein
MFRPWIRGMSCLVLFLVVVPSVRASHILGPVQSASFPVGPGAGDVAFSDPVAKFLILEITASAGSTGDRVEVDLGYGTDVFNLTPGQRFWTRPVGGSSVTLRYLDNGDGVGGAVVDRYGRGEQINLFQTTSPFVDPTFSTAGFCGGGPSWQNVACLSDADPTQALMKTVAKSVGMAVMIGPRSESDPTIVVSSCTATLIAPDLVLTAAHCFAGADDVASASFTLDYLSDCAGNRPAGYDPKFFKVKRLVRSGFEDPPAGEVDYAVLQVDTGISGIGVPPLPFHSGPPPALDTEVFIIHHPRGVPKKVSRQPLDAGCKIVAPASSSVIDFGCDLDNGSSGSPLFDLSGEVIGVNDWAGGCSNGAQTATVIRPDMVNPVPPPVDVNVMAVLDRSGSMSLPDLSGGPKLAKAQEAAELFYNLLRTDHTYKAGLVSFSTTATPDRDPVLVSAASKADLVATSGALTASGLTTIGGGVKLARQKLIAAGGPNSPDILLMTDGLQNTDPSIEEAEMTLGPTRLCAVGFGTEASLDGPRLTRLARDHGGIYVRAGEGLDLKKFFALCFGNLFESGISMDPFETLAAGVPASPPVPLQVCGEQTLTVVAGWTDPAGSLYIELTTPGGVTLTSATAGVSGGAGSTWAYLRLPLPFGGERDGTWKVRVVRPGGGGEFPPPTPLERYFLTTVIKGGPRLRAAAMPPLYTGDPLDPRVILRDPRGMRFPATMQLTVERPTDGTGNLLTASGLGPATVVAGDAVDARASTLIAMERTRGQGELVGRTTTTFPLFDDDDHGDRSLEPDGQFGNAMPDLTRFEGNYTFHAKAAFGDGCTGTRETFWSAYVAVGIDPGQTGVTVTPTGALPGGKEGLTVHVTPKDRYGNFLGPGRGDSIVVGGLPGSDPVGGPRDLGNGTYDQDVAWDPGAEQPPGITVGQPGRPVVNLPASPPFGVAPVGVGKRGFGLAFGSAFPAGDAARTLGSGFAARLHYRQTLAPRFSLVGALGVSNFGAPAPVGKLPLWDLTLGGRWDSAPAPAVRAFVEGGPGFYLADAPGNHHGFGLYLGVGIDVPLVPSKLDLEISLQGHKLPGDDHNPDFLRALIGLEVHP